MKVSIIGRTETLFNVTQKLMKDGYCISAIITGKAAPEYQKNEEDFKQLAADKNIPFICCQSFKSKEALSFIEKNCMNSDIGISINFPTVIPKNVIDLFPLGILNAHGGDLPKYRGNACQAWAIINKEERIGLCIHKMAPELDSGDIIERSFFPIDISTRIGEVYEWFETEIPILFKKAIVQLEQDPDYILEKQSTDPKKALRCYPRVPEDGKIDWTESAENIVRLVNASSEPFVGAYCFYKSEKLIIWEAIVNKDYSPYLAVPGQIASIDRRNVALDVVTGNGVLTITRMSLANSNHETAIKNIKSIRVRLK